MQALNLLISESAPVFYILGLDREKIAAGLAAKYEKLLPYLSETSGSDKIALATAGTEFGYTYIEKFIQLPFLVPQPADTDIDKFLDSLGSGARKSQGTIAPTPDVDPGLLVELSADSESVRDVVKMVAPSLDYNPRRLKQFVNLFRLRALLASQTGLFGPSRDPKEYDPLTFEQLGKLVAIILRWPLLLVDLERKPDLLKVLQALAFGDLGFLKSAPTEIEKFWQGKQNLMELIGYPQGLDALVDRDPTLASYRVDRVDIQRFLQVSPVVVGRESVDKTVAHATTAQGERGGVPQEVPKEADPQRNTSVEESREMNLPPTRK